jgi:hypothetical protein
MQVPKKKAKKTSVCANTCRLKRKAKKIVKLLKVDQGLKGVRPLPLDITCGRLRDSIRSIYSSELTLVQELSIKTSAKAESQPCDYCESLQLSDMIGKWTEKRLKPAEVNSDHLHDFGTAFAKNVPYGWNKRKDPYVPNGHATLESSRKSGGNWVSGEFSAESELKLIFSSGKPRLVTLYSEHNVRVLTPLHHSLYSFLKRRNWLLVGSPTGERLRYLSSGTDGPMWLSFDYIGATDNIKTAYVQRAVDILIDKGEGLSEDEVRCLRVFSELSLGGVLASTGQPMGSPMSFPVLCLINKTVVDLALTDLLITGEIGFKEWSRHRCLINGDDLLTKSTSKGSLESSVAYHGGQVGMETNAEKTLKDPEYGEINSTVFKNCILQKKTNVSSLWMGADVDDVLGFADQSCATVKGFKAVTVANVSRLARQKIKTVGSIPYARKEALCSSRRLKTALLSRPASEGPKTTELFPVVPMPAGYCLTREEEYEAISLEVDKVRSECVWRRLPQEKKDNQKARKKILVVVPEGRIHARKGVLRALKAKKPVEEERVLRCLALYWEKKKRKEMVDGDSSTFEFRFEFKSPLNPYGGFSVPELVSLLPADRDASGADFIRLQINKWKQKRVVQAKNQPPLAGVCFSNNSDFVSLY